MRFITLLGFKQQNMNKSQVCLSLLMFLNNTSWDKIQQSALLFCLQA